LLDSESFDYFVLRAEETKSEEDELCWEELLRIRDFLHFPTSSGIFGPFHANYKSD